MSAAFKPRTYEADVIIEFRDNSDQVTIISKRGTCSLAKFRAAFSQSAQQVDSKVQILKSKGVRLELKFSSIEMARQFMNKAVPAGQAPLYPKLN